MIRPDQIPDEAVEAACSAYAGCMLDVPSEEALRAAIAAALGAWPGAHVHEWQRPWLGDMSGTDIVLPMPQEASD